MSFYDNNNLLILPGDTGDLKRVLVDEPYAELRYVGISQTSGSIDPTKPVWRIYRRVRVSTTGIYQYDFADFGKYTNVWDDRASYFDAPPPATLPVPSNVYPSGLRNGGRITEVTLGATGWTKLPDMALPGRNALGIQNLSGIQIKLNYAPNTAGYEGVVIADHSERYYDITDAISIYAKAEAGSPTVTVEEIS